MTNPLATLRDAHLQRYACRLRESRGKPLDVVVCYWKCPKPGRWIERRTYNPHLSDRISTAGFAWPRVGAVENGCKDGEGAFDAAASKSTVRNRSPQRISPHHPGPLLPASPPPDGRRG